MFRVRANFVEAVPLCGGSGWAMKTLATVLATVVLGGGAMMGMGYYQQHAAAAHAVGGVPCVLPVSFRHL